MKKKICIITGSRAEYGLFFPLMREILKNPSFFELQIIATGMHLSPEFGLTYKEIERDGFKIDSKVEMLLSSETDIGVTKSVGLGIIGFSEALNKLSPDIVVILGDRFEAIAGSLAAYIAKIPIAHIHGGEITEGALDDGFRHAITKLSHFHFVSTEEYRKRVIQMGENPEYVLNVGALGIDNIKNFTYLEKLELERELKFNLSSPYILLTYHPETLGGSKTEKTLDNIFRVLENKENEKIKVIITMPNADNHGRIFFKKIDEFVRRNSSRAISFVSMGQKKYLSALKYSDAVVGNSSSGIIEAPSLNIPTINIGDRQKGRIRSGSIIDCGNSYEEICDSFKKIFQDDEFKCNLNYNNPYGNGHAAEKIIFGLKNFLNKPEFNKKFFDLKEINFE